MIKSSLIVVFSLFLLTNIVSQNYFVKTYDFNSTEDSYQIHNYNGRFFINTGTFCLSECSFVTEIDSFGDILWRTQIPDIDIATGSLIVHNDTITVTGNNDPFNDRFRMVHFSLDGEQISETFEIENPGDKYNRMFHLTSQLFNNRIILCGAGVKNDTSFSIIFSVSNIGELDTLILLEPTNHESDIWDSFIDQEGLLTSFHQVEFGNSPINYRKIYKFDENLDTVWSYTSEYNEDNTVFPKGCELQDGRIILSFVNPQGIRDIHSIRAINQDGSIDWQHNYPVNGSRVRYIIRLKTLDNGDIMGSGIYAELNHIPKVNDSPWLFRMSAEGELLWERTYFDIDTADDESRRGVLFDFEELENGDILAVGYFKYENNDMLIMRVDSNGCFDTNDCNEVNILTGNEVLVKEKSIELYPNPVINNLFLKSDWISQKSNYRIYNVLGALMIQDSMLDDEEEIKVNNLPPGVYIFCLSIDGKMLPPIKFIKVNSD